MNYQVVKLSEKKIIGIAVRTSNQSPDMGEQIGGLWKKLYDGAISSIPEPVCATSYGLYTNYQSDVNGEYDVIAGLEVSKNAIAPAGYVAAEIPQGLYAKFSFKGDATGGVGALWNKIWATELNRKYQVDFEEYLPSEDMTNAEMNIYISINE